MDAGSSDTAPRTEPNRTARTLPRQAVAEGAQLCVARGQAVRVLCLRLPRLLLGAGQTRGLRRQLRGGVSVLPLHVTERLVKR